MNACALWRCIGSELPGGYSTAIIRPSLPGRFVRSFDKTSVTLASCASSELDVRHASAKISFANVIKIYLSLDRRHFNASCVLVGPSQLRVVPYEFLFST